MEAFFSPLTANAMFFFLRVAKSSFLLVVIEYYSTHYSEQRWVLPILGSAEDNCPPPVIRPLFRPW